jgi:hypothetical protein
VPRKKVNKKVEVYFPEDVEYQTCGGEFGGFSTCVRVLAHPAPARRSLQGWRACSHAQPTFSTRGDPATSFRKAQLH